MKRERRYRGVTYVPEKRKWIAQVNVKKIRYLKYFIDKGDALRWYEEKVKELGVYDVKYTEYPDGLEKEFK